MGMGQQRFLHTIRQQNRGFATGQDTDVNQETEEEGEHAESEDDADAADPVTSAGNNGPLENLLESIKE